MRTCFFTIAAKNYLPQVRILAESLARFEPGIPFFFVLSDQSTDAFQLDAKGISVIPAASIDVTKHRELAYRYDVMEFATAIKPSAFQHLLKSGMDRVVYLDPDIEVFGGFDQLWRAFDQGASTVLTPHALTPLSEPLERDRAMLFLQAGTYNLGFMAIRNCPEVALGLDWWCRRLELDCVADGVGQGLFVDQKFINLWPCYVAGTWVLRDPGYNVAHWNIEARRVLKREGAWTVNSSPLVFMHFSGYQPEKPNKISRHRSSDDISMAGEGAELYRDYARKLIEQRARLQGRHSYSFDCLEEGEPIPPFLRAFLRRRAAADLGPLFAPPSQWFLPPGFAYQSFVVSREPDLQASFDLHTNAGKRAMIAWFLQGKDPRAALPGKVRQALREWLDRSTNESTARLGDGARFKIKQLRQSCARLLLRNPSLYRVFPQPVRTVGKRLLGMGGRSVLLDDPGAVNIFGYFSSPTGIGQAGRSLALALTTQNVKTKPVPVESLGHPSIRKRKSDSKGGSQKRPRVFCLNLDQIESVRSLCEPMRDAGLYNICYPFWELEKLPERWRPNIVNVDEFWAPSKLIERALTSFCDKPTIYVGTAVQMPIPTAVPFDRFGLDAQSFVVLSIFDLGSYAARKNPLGSIGAFQRAFAGHPGDDRVKLVLKFRGPDLQGGMRQQLALAAERDARIVLIDEDFSQGETAALLKRADVFLSLHRSEGFGLVLAEALLLGKPVVATAYGGCMDFLAKENAFLVNHTFVGLRPGEYLAGEGQVWADPDLDEGARHLRAIYEAPDRAAEMAQKGGSRIQADFSPSAVGHRIKERLYALELI